jgi:Tol biopolymer transport system component
VTCGANSWIGSGGGSSSSGAHAAPSSVPARAGAGRTPLLVAAAGVLVALAALAYAFGPWGASRASQPLARFTVESPAGTVLQLPAEGEWAPDGQSFFFAAVDSANTPRLYVRPIDDPKARLVPGTENASLAFWSPDGRSIGFFAAGKLRRVQLDGSSPAILCDAPDARGGTWSKQGVIVFAPEREGGLMQVSSAGGQPTAVTTVDHSRGERGHRYPQFLPDGRHFLYTAIGTGEDPTTYVGDLSGAKPFEVVRTGTVAHYVAPGWLYSLDTGINFMKRRLVMRRFDPRTFKVSGPARVVLDEVASDNFGYGNVSANHGALLAQHWTEPHHLLDWRTRSGAPAGIAVADLDGHTAALSPDGRRIAYVTNETPDIAVMDLASGAANRITYMKVRADQLEWSTDGRMLAFARLPGPRGWEIHTKAADGSGPDSLLFKAPGIFAYPMTWSPDGSHLLARASDAKGNIDLWTVPLVGGGAPGVLESTPAAEVTASYSPDGRWLVTVLDDGGTPSVFIRSASDPGARYQLNAPGLRGAVWSGDGYEVILFGAEGRCYSSVVSFDGGFRQSAPQLLFTLRGPEGVVGYDKSTKRFLFQTEKPGSVETRLDVVLGWQHLLEKK